MVGLHSEGEERNRIMAFLLFLVLLWIFLLDILLHGAKSVHAFRNDTRMGRRNRAASQQQQGIHDTACMG